MIKSILGFLFLMATFLMAMPGSGQMIRTPTAFSGDQSLFQYGIGFHFLRDEDELITDGEAYARFYAGRFVYDGYLVSDYGLHSLHVTFLEHKHLGLDIFQYLGAGVRNAGWEQRSDYDIGYSMIGAYFVYTVFLKKTYFNLGFAKNRYNSPDYLLFFGLQQSVGDRSHFVVEFDGLGLNAGFQMNVKDIFSAYSVFSANYISDEPSRVPLLSLGGEWMAKRIFGLSSGSSFGGNQRPLVGADGKEVMDEDLLTSEDFNIDLERAITTMQQGVQYYMNKQYVLAKLEFEKLIKLYPTAQAYVRLGSVCHQLGEKDQAVKYWNKALSLDPKNNKLRDTLRLMKEVENVGGQD